MSSVTRLHGRALYELQRELLANADEADRVPSLDRYSLGNQLLIAYQFPMATDVAGFRAWLKRGRRVRKGERGIAILAPTFVNRVDGDGTEAARRFYRTVHVFDISQTDLID